MREAGGTLVLSGKAGPGGKFCEVSRWAGRRWPSSLCWPWFAARARFILTHSAAEIFRHLLNATWAAVAVAILEELVFRGALFGLLRQAMPWPAAVVVSSAVYAAVHFIQKGETAMPVHWYSGLALLWQMLCHPPSMIPDFLTLLAAGSILALSYQRTGALYFSIGLHAGWIFWVKSYGFLLQPTGAGSWFWGTDKLIDGWLSCITLAIVLILVARQKRLGAH